MSASGAHPSYSKWYKLHTTIKRSQWLTGLAADVREAGLLVHKDLSKPLLPVNTYIDVCSQHFISTREPGPGPSSVLAVTLHIWGTSCSTQKGRHQRCWKTGEPTSMSSLDTPPRVRSVSNTQYRVVTWILDPLRPNLLPVMNTAVPAALGSSPSSARRQRPYTYSATGRIVRCPLAASQCEEDYRLSDQEVTNGSGRPHSLLDLAATITATYQPTQLRLTFVNNEIHVLRACLQSALYSCYKCVYNVTSSSQPIFNT